MGVYAVQRRDHPGRPLGHMAMYAIGTQPLIRRLDGHAKQVWYADDSSAGSSIERLKAWWDKLELRTTLRLLPQRLQDPSPCQARGCRNSQGSFP